MRTTCTVCGRDVGTIAGWVMKYDDSAKRVVARVARHTATESNKRGERRPICNGTGISVEKVPS